MDDQSNLNMVFNKFHGERVAPLMWRYPGIYRAMVVETNDPLQIHRVRVKCPILHDSNLKPEECPWADRAPQLGGKNAGDWTHPIKGDIVWVAFENGHPYSIVWTGFATPTRSKFYPLFSTFTKSPLALTENEEPDEKPTDYLEDYLPKDYRPMSSGRQDRYGHVTLTDAVGFVPKEHELLPAPTDTDAMSKGQFERGAKPEINKPDRKMQVQITKYGMICISSDVGYYWKKEKNGETGEFEGDFDKDRKWEIKRCFYIQKLLNENEPDSSKRDQRRYEARTRAGHKFEMRDVGWAQEAGGRVINADAGRCHSRVDEYGPPRVLSKWTKSDERWVKVRTKGGHLFQCMDAGFHPENDLFYKRLLLDEIGADVDGEKDAGWTERDARQIRMVTRWGTKLVLDDRGSDGVDAEGKEKPRANGWLLKTRRSWTSSPSTPRGFAFEAIDKDELNTSRWYSPKSKIIEMNDKKDYLMMCSDTRSEISRPWQKLRENEFALKIAMTGDPESDTYHCKLDKANGYLRLKTAAGKDNGRRPEPEGLEAAETGLNQGLEARDGRSGTEGPWTEIVDIDHRGLWFSRRQGLGIWRAKEGKDQVIVISDQKNQIVLRNNASGVLQLYCAGSIELISEKNIAFKAGGQISFKAAASINMEAGGSGHAQLTPGSWNMDVADNAPRHTGLLPGAMPGPGAQGPTGGPCQVLDPQPVEYTKKEPDDRAYTGGSFEEVPEKVVTGK